MPDLFAYLVEWAVKKKRWPLLTLLLVPMIFEFVQERYGLTYRIALDHWRFLIWSGVVIAVTGVLYVSASLFEAWKNRPRRGLPVPRPEVDAHRARIRSSLWRIPLTATLAVAGVVLIVWGIEKSRPPSDQLVVTITRFTSVGTGANEKAEVTRDYLRDRLNEMENGGIPIFVDFVADTIPPDNNGAAQARELGRTRSAHLVAWGHARLDGNQLCVELRLTFANPVSDVSVDDEIPVAQRFSEPSQVRLISSSLSEEVQLVHALAYYKKKDLPRSISILEGLESAESHFYRGLAFQDIANQRDPQSNLKKAVYHYKEAISATQPQNGLGTVKPDCRDPSGHNELVWMAYFNLANAVAELSRSLGGDAAVTRLSEAVSAYRTAIDLYSKEGESVPAVLRSNLGFALYERALRLGDPTAATDDLKQAIRELEIALGEDSSSTQSTSEAHDDLTRLKAITWNNLGSAQAELSRRSPDKSDELLEKASHAFSEAEKLVDKATTPKLWAMVLVNSGSTSAEMGSRLTGDAAEALLQKGIQAYKRALDVYTRDSYPRQYASTQYNLGYTLLDLADRVPSNAHEDLNDAIEAFSNAIEVACPNDAFPLLCGRAQRDLGIARARSGKSSGGRGN